MSAIRLATAATVRAFQTLSHALTTNDSIDGEALEDEIGRFRVWSGNLGALQKGHSSLDYRLRDSPLLSSNALKFLGELQENLNETIAVVSGARLPYEQQPKPQEDQEQAEKEDDGFFDDDDDDDDDDEDLGSRTELDMRLAEIIDIVDNLYKLSVRIRTPTVRSRSLKAASYSPKDAETGVDLLGVYAGFDLLHVKELLTHLRQPHSKDTDVDEYEFLAARLSAAITLRRRQFKYWKRHRDKLGISTISAEQQPLVQPHPAIRLDALQRNDTLDVFPDSPVVIFKDAPSQKTGKTLLSGTEATQHHQTLDEIVDNKSVTSYAVTVKDINGKGVELPPPPLAADGEKDFECPYCYIICPARYGRGRAWRTHLLQDLQPYICTYRDCESGEQLFRSRREWAEHEATHRKAWRCPEHPNAVFKSQHGLENHLRSEHPDSFPESKLLTIIKVGEITTIDVRTRCPICCAPSEMNGLGDFHNHIANHLERIATFALPKSEDDKEGSSGAASHGHSHSSGSCNLSDLPLPVDASDRSVEDEGILYTDVSPSSPDTVKAHSTTDRTLLSAESLHLLPDASQYRIDTLFDAEIHSEADSHSAANNSIGGLMNKTGSLETGREGQVPSFCKPKEHEPKSEERILELDDIAILRSMHRSGKFVPCDQKSAPNDWYNETVSFCHYDITRLRVDAIINCANKAMRVTKGSALKNATLNNAIHKAAGLGLAMETALKGSLVSGRPVLTLGHELPCRHIIHVARPGYSGQYDLLKECYRSALDLAREHGLKTIAFPCLGTGGVGFDPRVAARIALKEVREYLDAHTRNDFERIIFCVHTAADEQAYMDNFSVYFPPTQNDRDITPSAVKVLDVCDQTEDTRNQVERASIYTGQMKITSSGVQPDTGFQLKLLMLSNSLASIGHFLLWSREIGEILADIDLACTVWALFCGSIREAIELMKVTSDYTSQSADDIWADYIDDLKRMSRTDPLDLLSTCQIFLARLHSITDGRSEDSEDMPAMRRKLETYATGSTRKDGERAQSRVGLFNEALHVQAFRREATDSSHIGKIVMVDQVPTLTQLYKLGKLQEKYTKARPSPIFNGVVCLIREDITKFEVDVLVNSTDRTFAGDGTLDRSIFAKGGPELRQAVEAFGNCNIGDVMRTRGYKLPAKHILHAVPPEHYTTRTQAAISRVYQKILLIAAGLGATSIAIPCIGTGVLDYPRHTSASLAIEEVKKFLETADRTDQIKKIIFVVHVPEDETAYKNLLPVFFPPDNLNAENTMPELQLAGAGAANAFERPGRKFADSLGEGLRSVRFGQQQLEMSRAINLKEGNSLTAFESHAGVCETCADPEKLYLEGRDLCEPGYALAQSVLVHMNMQADHRICTKPDANGNISGLAISERMYSTSLKLLEVVEKSYREGNRSRPFVSVDRSYNAIIQDQAPNSPVNTAEVEDAQKSGKGLYRKARARVFTGNKNSGWNEIRPDECQVRVFNTYGEIHAPESGLDTIPLLSFQFSREMAVERHKTAPEIVFAGSILFRCPNDAECNSLLRMLRRAIEHLPDTYEERSKDSNQADKDIPLSQASTHESSHGKKNKLKDIQDQISPNQQTSELGDLQYKIQRLNEAATSLSFQQEEANDNPQEETAQSHRHALATLLLDYLMQDMETRKGSYMGTKLEDIISGLRMTPGETKRALIELKSQRKIHNIINSNTWTVSNPPEDLSPIVRNDQGYTGDARPAFKVPTARSFVGDGVVGNTKGPGDSSVSLSGSESRDRYKQIALACANGSGAGKGKARKRERDDEQGRLERVLEGDMKETVLRHFEEDDEGFL